MVLLSCRVWKGLLARDEATQPEESPLPLSNQWKGSQVQQAAVICTDKNGKGLKIGNFDLKVTYFEHAA